MNKCFIFMLLAICSMTSCNDNDDVLNFPVINYVFSTKEREVFVHPGMAVEIEALEPFMMSSMNRWEGNPYLWPMEESIILIPCDWAKTRKMPASFKEQQASMSGVKLNHTTAKRLRIRLDDNVVDTVKIHVKARVTRKTKKGFDDKIDIYVIPQTE